MKLAEVIRNPKKTVKYLGARGFLNWMSDKTYCDLVFQANFHKKMDWDEPKSFNEKLQWLKLHDRNALYPIMVDKHAVRELIQEKWGGHYLIPLALDEVWYRAEDIPFERLPKQFVLKCTHGSGCNVICKDKSRLDIEQTRNKIRKWMKQNWFWYGREWPYKELTPKIIAEKYMSDESCDELKDYKVLCFNGKPRLIEVHTGRFNEKHQQIFYDTNWNKTQITQTGLPADADIAEPPTLKQMLSLSGCLAEGTKVVRIDWYDIGGQLYFGEFTLYDGSGFQPFDRYEDDLLLGSWINLFEEGKQ